MKKLLCLAIICLYVSQTISAQVATIIPNSYVPANASVSYVKAWLPFHNPAALSHEKIGAIQLQYDNRYITKELSTALISGCYSTPYVNIGASFSYFGYSVYNEMLAGLTFARTFGDRFSVGIEFDYYTVYFSPSERYKGTVTANIGMQAKVIQNFYISFSAFNPVFSKIKTDFLDKSLPVVFSLGTLYQITEQVDWLTQLDKEVKSPLRWATGVEYHPFKEFLVNVGVYGSDYVVPTLGIGIQFSGVEFHLNTEYHTTLGFSALGALRYTFQSDKAQ
ncbi:MAG: hypothetical protein EOM76_02240 [Sphingobacteriia bacterium]|nr:hypothetical protein [Sphingobacteriia bacterium]